MYYKDHNRVHAEYSPHRLGYDIHILRYENNMQTFLYGKEIKYEEVNSHETINFPPPITLDKEDAQALFDDLWRAGLRPSTKDDTPAKDEHIRDLRMIAFHALGMTG